MLIHVKANIATSELTDTAKAILEKLTVYWENIKEHATVCMILDPRFKLDYIKGDKQRKESIDIFEKYYKPYEPNDLTQSAQSSDNLLANKENSEKGNLPKLLCWHVMLSSNN